ncbi:flavodoxin family protein [Chitinophaga sp. Mgbs1]|uniref:Flavodoxin family protein n=1 Tax=Chitinophaga solisilvae TaxID=1233460 RepID=A0A433WC46_9BACT|nr:flavodoxin family protein [Chitinophaga solisilvae]
MKKIVIINGHPYKESLNYALHAAYRKGALEAGATVEDICIGELSFDPNLRHGYSKRMDLEPDLLAAWEKIQRADHLVWIYPQWWGFMPAVTKGFLDRLFLPGLAFKRKEGTVMATPSLKGKTAHIIHTMDYPVWYYKWIIREGGIKIMKKVILEFCGIKTKKVTYIGPSGMTPIKHTPEAYRQKHIERVEQAGRQLM